MKRILMVDDVATNLRCAAEILKENYEIITAKSGKKALEILENTIPDLLLIDVNMPGINGFEVLGRVRQIPELSHIPGIFLVEDMDRNVEERGKQMGVSDYIRKPFEPDELMRIIDKVFQENQKKPIKSASKIDTTASLLDRNRRKLTVWADEEGTAGYLVLFRLENFDSIDTALGSFAREEVILKIGDVLKEIPGNDGCFCHMRDNVFGTYFGENFGIDLMKSTLRRMIAEMEFEINEIVSEDFEIKIMISAGIASKPEDGKDYGTLFEHADKALYFATEMGKARFHFYSMKHEEAHEGAEEGESIHLLQLKHQIETRSTESADSKKCLQMAHHVISRYWESEGVPIQIIFFGIVGEDAKEQNMDILSKVITGSLRKGDVAVKCGKYQYLVVLQNASVENGGLVAGRIKKNFEQRSGGAKSALVYEVESMEA